MVMDALTSTKEERQLLGLALRESEAAVEIANGLTHEDFVQEQHQRLMYLLVQRIGAGRPVDLESMIHEVDRLGASRFGGLAYVCEHSDYVASSFRKPGPLIERVRERAMRRRLAAVFGEASKAVRLQPGELDGVKLPTDVSDLAAMVGQRVLDVSQPTRRTSFMAGEASDEAFAERQQRRELGLTPAYSTGHPLLDGVLAGGLHRGNVIVVAGRPGWGKSAFIQSVFLHSALQGNRVAYLSLEMDRRQIADRLLANLAEVSYSVLRADALSSHAAKKVEAQRAVLRELHFLLEVRPRITPEGIAAWVRWCKAEGYDMVAIDYIQLVKHGELGNDAKAIIETARVLNELSIDLQMPIVAASQMNRDVQGRSAPRWPKDEPPPYWWQTVPAPQSADLKDGGIEATADVVMFTQHGGFYGLDPTLGALRVDKNRNGPTETVPAEAQLAQMAWRPCNRI